ncbi:hypothetical protein GCM10009665_35350 [Kitasatospora nipponensis]|uniref:Uncharacterized protein n=1 Tax=Kitasatospora nipponensis TaxID=258049 RepID=A0ABN1WA40_9ACTN
MRVYVPTTLAALAQAHPDGALEQSPAYAVTPALREWYVSDDIEELEYAALVRAAQSSLRLLAADPGAPRRRVVVALDVPDAAVKPFAGDEYQDQLSLGQVVLAAPVRLAKAAAVHADAADPEVAQDVATAADAVTAADAGDDDAQFSVDGAEDHELLWFATQEIPGLLG